MVVMAGGLAPLKILVLSQVALSFCLPFALVPLVLFTRRRDLMGTLVNRPVTTAAAVLTTAVVLALNGLLLFEVFGGRF